MALKRIKGYSIATRTIENRLYPQAKCFTGFDETKTYYNQVVEFFFALINTDSSGLSIPLNDGGDYMYYEVLVLGKPSQNIEAKFPLPDDFSGCPQKLRRSAIRAAMGAYKSWKTRYDKWKNRSKRHRHHKPPVHPRSFNFSPTYVKGMWKEDSGSDIMLKVLVSGQWKWLKFSYKGRVLGDEWVKGSPSIVLKNGGANLNFPMQRYVPATGGVDNITSKDSYRILGVDIDLDVHAAIVSILEVEGTTVREIARHFIKTPQGVTLRKRSLGRIARKMAKTGVIHKGFCFKEWEKIRNRESSMGYEVASQICRLAVGYGCEIISFEHLANLKPCRVSYSRRSNQKRAYWLKSKIFNNVRQKAYMDYGILTTRVNPRNTSKLDPWGNPVNRQNTIPDKIVSGSQTYEPGATWIKTSEGYTCHSGVNAGRNIGMKALLRHRTNLEFKVKSRQDLDTSRDNT